MMSFQRYRDETEGLFGSQVSVSGARRARSLPFSRGTDLLLCLIELQFLFFFKLQDFGVAGTLRSMGMLMRLRFINGVAVYLILTEIRKWMKPLIKNCLSTRVFSYHLF